LIERSIGGAGLAGARVGPHDVLDADDAVAPGKGRHAGSYSDNGTDDGEPAGGKHRAI
jgi:hypothetical protein